MLGKDIPEPLSSRTFLELSSGRQVARRCAAVFSATVYGAAAVPRLAPIVDRYLAGQVAHLPSLMPSVVLLQPAQFRLPQRHVTTTPP